MFELPKRLAELRVEFRGGDVQLYIQPLTDEEYYALSEEADVQSTANGDRLVYRLSRSPELFNQKLIRVVGIAVDGGEFDVANPDHLARIPQPWKVIALTKAIRYAMGLTEEEVGNSKGRAGSSPKAATPSKA